jgi:hypothetical protein
VPIFIIIRGPFLPEADAEEAGERRTEHRWALETDTQERMLKIVVVSRWAGGYSWQLVPGR